MYFISKYSDAFYIILCSLITIIVSYTAQFSEYEYQFITLSACEQLLQSAMWNVIVLVQYQSAS
jgi:hypothetical protein